MVFVARSLLIVAVLISLSNPFTASAAKKSSGASQEALSDAVEKLQKNPSDRALREKIIKMARGMKSAPAVPEEAERHMARGTTFAQKASDLQGYTKAIAEFEAAANAAPWLALAYFNLGVVQERAELQNEAIQSLKYYLLASPDAKNARDVKNKIYALEAEVEDMKAIKGAAPAAPAQKGLSVAGNPELEIDAEKQLNIIKMPPPEKKTRIPSFVGNWFFKDTLRGEDLTIQAFEITKNASGDIVAIAPKRAGDYVPIIRVFEINDKNLKIDIHWRMKSVVGYWKIESYNLTLSDDSAKLAGTYVQKSVGGRVIEVDRTLFKQ